MNILNAYKYLFYRIYVWLHNSFGEDQNPVFTAMFLNSLCIFINLLTLAVFVQIFTNYTIRIENIHAIMGMLLLYLINYFVLLYNNKSKAIIAKFSKESDIQRKQRTIWCCVYLIATYLIFIVSVIILSPQSK